MTSDELTKQLKHCSNMTRQLEYHNLTWFCKPDRIAVFDKDKKNVFNLSPCAIGREWVPKLKAYLKSIEKREIKTTKESMQGELL